jgi:protein-L-isoaspartate O-methyltransferase
MDEKLRAQILPGAMAKVTQQIPARNYVWTSEIRGEILSFEQKQTGSWYAHSKDHTLWLDRLTLRKADGEITTLNLDEYTAIEIEKAAPTAPVA